MRIVESMRIPWKTLRKIYLVVKAFVLKLFNVDYQITVEIEED